MIESTHSDISIINALKESKGVVKKLNDQMNVDDIADLKDELAELEADMDERQEFFADVAKEGQEELLEEIDELEVLVVKPEVDVMPIGEGPIYNHNNKDPLAAEESKEEDEFEALKNSMKAAGWNFKF